MSINRTVDIEKVQVERRSGFAESYLDEFERVMTVA